MSVSRFRAGVADVAISTINSSVNLPACTTLSFTASAVSLTDSLYNSVLTDLPASTNMQVAIALIGSDSSTDGYAVTPSSPASGILSLTAGQGIQVTVPNANWPANFQYAAGIAIFLKQGNANFQLAHVQPVDAINDFVTTIVRAPLSSAESWTIATLQGTGNNTGSNSLGDSRSPVYGYTFTTISPTTRDVVVTNQVGGSVQFTPNTSADFNIATSRPQSLSFAAMANDVKTIIQATAGDYWQYTAGGHTFTEASQAINTAKVLVKGNKPLILTMPPDPATGVSETVLMLGLLLQNQQEVAMAWSKRNETPVPLQFSAIPNSPLFNNQPTVFIRSRN